VLDATTALVTEHRIRPDDIKAMRITMPDDRMHIVDNGKMPDVCVQHMAALIIADGALSFASTHDHARMHDEAVLAVRRKITMIASPELSRAVPALSPLSVWNRSMTPATSSKASRVLITAPGRRNDREPAITRQKIRTSAATGTHEGTRSTLSNTPAPNAPVAQKRPRRDPSGGFVFATPRILEPEHRQCCETSMSMFRPAIGFDVIVGKPQPVTLATSFGVHYPTGQLFQFRLELQVAERAKVEHPQFRARGTVFLHQ